MSIDIAKTINELLMDKGKKQKDLVEHLGHSQSTVAKWLSLNKNTNRDMPYDVILKTADFLDISTDTLLGGSNIKPVKSIPVLGTASCGNCEVSTLQDENMRTVIDESSWNKDLYAVIANGDSMATEIYDSDICIVDPNEQIQSGDIVFYKLDDEAAIKVFVEDKENYLIHFVPFSSNDCFKTKTVRLDDEETASKLIISKVVKVVSEKKNNRSARLKMIGR